MAQKEETEPQSLRYGSTASPRLRYFVEGASQSPLASFPFADELNDVEAQGIDD